MPKVGYFLSSEEFGPNELIEQAKMAQKAGFEALWTSEQGNPSFVWSVIGGLSQATSLPVATGVTCPTMRTHPAIVAQAPRGEH
jgi:alkanesulfonate monooxygenase SsuD/methylene tetrahydromethanopterin reductase-like flavin-dependent oxidoreductase (luciferase family)